MKATIVVALALASGCANVHVNRAALVMSTAMIACDWAQTDSEAATQWSNYYEKNPIIGLTPTRGEVAAYFTAAVVLNAAVWYLLPERYRAIVPAGVSVIQMKSIAHNIPRVGVCGLTTGDRI